MSAEDIVGTNTNTDAGSILTDGLPVGDASGQQSGDGTQNQNHQDQGQQKDQGQGNGDQTDGSDPEKKGQDAKDGEVPEAYTLKMPEGVEVDSKLLEAVTPLFKELKITNDAAQKIADVFVAHQQSEVKASLEAFESKVNGWIDEIKSDKVFGGTKFDATKQNAQAFVARFGDDQLKQDLAAYRIGNLPSLIRAFARAGLGMAEDTLRGGQQQREPSRSDKLAAMYPSMDK